MTVAFFAALVFAIVRYGQIEQISHRGSAMIADGDTLVLSGLKVRLEGIDAPEYNQTCQRAAGSYPCGREARQRLAALAAKAPVECSGWQNDKYGRLLGVCNAAGVDLNREMVVSGWAVSYGNYFAEEVAARKGGKGVWQGEFVRPSEWRRTHDRFAAANDAPHDFWSKWMAFLWKVIGLE
jgi:endonuclease YncB( thermonuclease family)